MHSGHASDIQREIFQHDLRQVRRIYAYVWACVCAYGRVCVCVKRVALAECTAGVVKNPEIKIWKDQFARFCSTVSFRYKYFRTFRLFEETFLLNAHWIDKD